MVPDPATNRIGSTDANGNQLSDPSGSYGYNVSNRIVIAVPISGGQEHYSYSPDNLRAWKMMTDSTEELHFYGAYGERLGRTRS